MEQGVLCWTLCSRDGKAQSLVSSWLFFVNGFPILLDVKIYFYWERREKGEEKEEREREEVGREGGREKERVEGRGTEREGRRVGGDPVSRGL